MKTESDVLKQFAAVIVQRIADDTVHYLDTKKNDLTGEKSDLEYFWEETYNDRRLYEDYKDKDYSVWDVNKGLVYDDTVRSFVNSFWGVFEDAARAFISLQLAVLQSHEKLAVWLYTDQGINWRYGEEESETDTIPVTDKDIQDDIIKKHLYDRRDAWLNNMLLDFFDQKLMSFLSRRLDENFDKEQKEA